MRLLTALLLLACASAARVDFTGHRVVRATVRDASDIAFLRSLPESTDGVRGVDVMSNDGVLRVGPATLRLTPAGYKAFAASGIPHSVHLDDLEAHIRRHSALSDQSTGNADFFSKFQRYDAIVERVQQIAKENAGWMQYIPEIGRSIENRSIVALRIGRGSCVGCNTSFVLAGAHAREWVGHMVGMWWLSSFADDYNNGNKDVKAIVDNTVVYYVPCYNPDGYEYSHTTNRYWRKNRRLNYDGSYGVDPNRNWDSHWAEVGDVPAPSEETYPGTGPASEPEIKAVSQLILSHKNVRAVLDLHSHASLILRPYGYTRTPPKDDVLMTSMSDEVARIIKSVRGTSYGSQRMSDMYLGCGDTSDWSYDKVGAIWSYTFELAGVDFIVPASDIKKQGKDIYPAITHLLRISA